MTTTHPRRPAMRRPLVDAAAAGRLTGSPAYTLAAANSVGHLPDDQAAKLLADWRRAGRLLYVVRLGATPIAWGPLDGGPLHVPDVQLTRLAGAVR